MADFVAQLDEINALAEASPGFVWRLQDEAGDATAIRPFEDDSLMINMSVWESREALWRFVYDSEHLAVMRRRREWFERMKVFMALWWIPAGTLPTLEDARERLTALEAHGPMPYAFSFKRPFSPVGVEALPGLAAELSLCD